MSPTASANLSGLWLARRKNKHCSAAGKTNVRVPHIPDFLSRLLGSAYFMRLFLKKGARAVMSSSAYRKFGVSRSFFPRCGIPRLSTSSADWEGNDSALQQWYPTSREKRARYGAPGDWLLGGALG